YMLSKVKVISEEEYLTWYHEKTPESDTLEAVGLQVIKRLGCVACHSQDGSKIVGPTFKNLYGATRKVTLADGSTKEIVADEEYIKRAISDPNAEIVDGYQKNLMQSYKTQLNDEEIKEVIDYLKGLK
nr:cytochrome c [Bacteroidales bacterium]